MVSGEWCFNQVRHSEEHCELAYVDGKCDEESFPMYMSPTIKEILRRWLSLKALTKRLQDDAFRYSGACISIRNPKSQIRNPTLAPTHILFWYLPRFL